MGPSRLLWTARWGRAGASAHRKAPAMIAGASIGLVSGRQEPTSVGLWPMPTQSLCCGPGGSRCGRCRHRHAEATCRLGPQCSASWPQPAFCAAIGHNRADPPAPLDRCRAAGSAAAVPRQSLRDGFPWDADALPPPTADAPWTAADHRGQRGHRLALRRAPAPTHPPSAAHKSRLGRNWPRTRADSPALRRAQEPARPPLAAHKSRLGPIQPRTRAGSAWGRGGWGGQPRAQTRCMPTAANPAASASSRSSPRS
jgi:hypothetical protein